MSDLELFFVVPGDSPASRRMFGVKAAQNTSVSELKKLVYAELRDELDGIGARNLVLWKLNNPIPADDVDKEVPALCQDLSPVAVEMLPANDLSDYFTTRPPRKSLHIIVKVPPASGSWGALVATRTPPNHPDNLPKVKTTLSNDRKRLREDEDAVTPRDSGDALPVGAQKRRRLDLLEGSKTIYKSESDPDRLGKIPLLPTSSNFEHLISTPNIVAADKTIYIEELDKYPQYQLMFLRPRRWGKSTFLQMLANYYDMSKADEFDDTFGQLYIGKHPTKDRSSLLVLLFDFSRITTFESPHETRKELNAMMLQVLRKFLETNKRFLGYPNSETLLSDDGADALQNVLTLVEGHKRKLFVGVDEYDAPANACLFSAKVEHYPAIAELFKARFFAIIKQAVGFVVQKYWLTGVLPAFRDGISPLTATEVISMSPHFNNACGLTEDEVHTIAKAYLASTHSEDELARELETMKQWFNGYQFCPSGGRTAIPTLYNPQLVFTHLRTVGRKAGHMRPDEEVNATHTATVLNAIRADGDLNVHGLLPLLSGRVRATIMTGFGAPEVQQIGQRADITWTLLYYFGVITRGEGDGLRIPNHTMRNLITGRFRDYLRQVDPAFARKMTASCGAFVNGKPELFVEILEEFFRKRPVRSVFDSNEANLQSVIEICWFEEGTCLPELCLVVNPAKTRGDGRFGFIDLFIASSPESHASTVALIELKQVTLHGLCRALTANANEEPSSATMESLRKKLEKETENKLLQRTFCYWDKSVKKWCKSSILNFKQAAVGQVNNYLRVAKNGAVRGAHGGILDKRIICEKGEDCLVGYVVIGIGGTRVLTWEVGREQTQYSFRKALIGAE